MSDLQRQDVTVRLSFGTAIIMIFIGYAIGIGLSEIAQALKALVEVLK